jgi:hypothetical protein
VVNTDGTGRRRLVGRDTTGAWSPEDSIRDLSISPDGRTIAILTRPSPGGRRPDPDGHDALTVNSDGSGLEPRSLETILAIARQQPWLPSSRGREGRALILLKRNPSSRSAGAFWAYDLDRKTASKVRDIAIPAS